jgi:hypothetical protein
MRETLRLESPDVSGHENDPHNRRPQQSALGTRRYFAGGLFGEFAAGLRAAVGGLQEFSVRHDAFQISPHYSPILRRSIFAEWGLNLSEYSSWGVPRKINEPS